MDINDIIKKRYTTKIFDPNKKISDAEFAQIKDILRLSPSSTNLQPWHFVLAQDKAGLERVAKGAKDNFVFNKSKILDASHVVVFCAKTYADEEHLERVLVQEEKDGRFVEEAFKAQVEGGRHKFLRMHRFGWRDESQWHAHQAYISMGMLLLGVASMGIDACIMEGIDTTVLNEEFELTKKGYSALSVIALGYRAEDDFNVLSKLPKSRLSEEIVFSKA